MSRSIAVDTSALVAIALREPDAAWLLEQIFDAETCIASLGSIQEFLVVLGSLSNFKGVAPHGVRDFAMQFLSSLNITVEPVTAALALIGSQGILRFRQGPAKLNFGDGFSYAIAKSRDIPLLCLGNDFPHTDISVLQP